jgi:hypothetical protein
MLKHKYNLVIKNREVTITKQDKLLRVPLRYKDDGPITLNLHQESQGHIPSFNSSRENINHGPFTFGFNIALRFQCKEVLNGHIK